MQSPVVRNLKAITDIIKPSGYGINKVSRHRSLPSNRSNAKLNGSQSNISQMEQAQALETVSEEQQEFHQFSNDNSQLQYYLHGKTVGDE